MSGEFREVNFSTQQASRSRTTGRVAFNSSVAQIDDMRPEGSITKKPDFTVHPDISGVVDTAAEQREQLGLVGSAVSSASISTTQEMPNIAANRILELNLREESEKTQGDLPSPGPKGPNLPTA
jgi:hypothetical protein